MDSLARLLADDFQIALPHVAADEFQSCGSLLAKEAKESQQCLCLPIRADPQEPFLILVDLIHHRLVFVSSMPLHLVDADRRDSVQVAVGQAPPDCLFYRTKHAIPADSEGLGDLLPGHPPSPASQVPGVLVGDRALAVSPRHPLHLHAALRAVDPTHRVDEHDRNSPQRDEVEPPG